ncbi:multicopper oxidase domain-containing protein [Nitrosococcus halophilus]|uniref:multicopper oxidase domain-containing protein n=1 Tax=Nitrosococcus halophilus TaxID=133539 RepID=UPI00059D8BA6|nr:multicopper oxidase domain-containing protein [Nitrosococcus halophilus]
MVLATSSHHIKLAAEKLPNGQYGYKMLQHRVSNAIGPQDHTALYADIAVIPGAILFAKQGDVVKVELTNNTEVKVGFEVPGFFNSYGTKVDPGKTQTYTFNANRARTYLYRDEHFQQVFPTLFMMAQQNSRPGVIPNPPVPSTIDTRLMPEPFATEVFTIKAGDGVGPGDWQYHCHVFAHMEAGMHGHFKVVEVSEAAVSIAGASLYGGIFGSSGTGVATFEISDEPGRWFKSTRGDITGTDTQSLELLHPNDSIHFIMSDTHTSHTMTSLLWPMGAENMPFDQVTSAAPWHVTYPSVPVQITGGAVADLREVLEARYGQDIQLANLFDPEIPGVGEVWIDTQFEKTNSKTKPGTITVLDAENWTIKRKISLPEINMNHPHNMWTDRDQKVVYQTQWFDNKLTFVDRVTGQLIKNIRVGESPAHVMTRPHNDTILVTLNGEEGNADTNFM